MKRLGMIGVVLLTMCISSTVCVSGAQAESAPFFSIGGTRLAAGKTHNLSGHAISKLELVTAATGSNITCTNATLEKGVMLGSEPGTAGSGLGISSFAGCKLESGNGAPNCHLAATEGGTGTSTTITTSPLRSELVENVEAGKGGKKLEELVRPAAGSIFVTVFFGGTGCEVLATKVTGSTAAEIVTDPGEESIELGKATTENSSFITRAPATAITEVWLVSGGTGRIVTVEQTVFSSVSVQHGSALGSLANSTFEPENTKWSPLP